MTACRINRRDLCLRYIATFGPNMAAIQTMEECGELTTALSHLIRDRKGSIDEVIEETADVAIMLDVIRAYLGGTKDSEGRTVDDILELKYQRMATRTATNNKNAGKE